MSLVSDIPETIKEIGRAQAYGAQAKGLYGRSIADIGQMIGQMPARARQERLDLRQERLDEQLRIGREQDLALGKQRLEGGEMDLANKKRDQEIDDAINAAMKQAIGPDGKIDRAKLAAILAGTPAAHKIPALMAQLDTLEKASLERQTAGMTHEKLKTDELGGHFAAANLLFNPSETKGPDGKPVLGPDGKPVMQPGDPHAAAAYILAAVSGMKARNVLTDEEARKYIGGMLSDVEAPYPEGPAQPDPAKVERVIRTGLEESEKQRTLGVNEEYRKSLAEDRAASTAARTKAAEDKALAAKLTAYSKQLGRTTSKDQYAAIYNKIPETEQAYFDSLEEWTPESADRALEVLISPEKRAELRDKAEGRSTAKATAAEARDRHDFDNWRNDWNEIQKAKVGAVDAFGNTTKAKYNPPSLDFENFRKTDVTTRRMMLDRERGAIKLPPHQDAIGTPPPDTAVPVRPEAPPAAPGVGAAPEAKVPLPGTQPAPATMESVFSSLAPPPEVPLSARTDWPGMIEPPNIPLNQQPTVKNAKGDDMTVNSSSYERDGVEVLMTSVTTDGKVLKTPKEINDYYDKTGFHLGKFDTPENADEFAKQLHKDYEEGRYQQNAVVNFSERAAGIGTTPGEQVPLPDGSAPAPAPPPGIAPPISRAPGLAPAPPESSPAVGPKTAPRDPYLTDRQRPPRNVPRTIAPRPAPVAAVPAPAPAAPPAPAPAPPPAEAKGGQGKTITTEDLRQSAMLIGITFEEAKQRAIDEGYKVLPPRKR